MKATLIAFVSASVVFTAGTTRAQDGGLFPEDTNGGQPAVADQAPAAGQSGAPGATQKTLGVGIASTISGLVGPAFELVLTPELMVTGLATFDIVSPDAADARTTVTLAGGLFYRVAGDAQTAFMVGGRLAMASGPGLAFNSGTASPGQTAFQVNLEVPARVQLWLTDLIAIHLETGLVMAFVPEEGPVIDPLFGPPGEVTIAVGGRLFGAGGVTVYLQ
jgi:hypothetical protein